MIAFYLRRFARLLTENIDGILFAAVLSLMILGLIVLYSASNAGWPRVSGQMINMLVALTVMWVVANVPPHVLMRLALPLFVLGFLLLIGVAVNGDVVNGARRLLHHTRGDRPRRNWLLLRQARGRATRERPGTRQRSGGGAVES